MKLKIIIIALFYSLSSYCQTEKLSDTIVLKMNEYNTNFVQVVFNEIDTLNLNFDTGTTEINLNRITLKNKLKSKPELYNKLYNVKIGNLTFETKVYDSEFSGQNTDGNFGWDFFKGKIVEINYEKEFLVIHSELPKNILNDNKYSKLKIEYWKDLFFIKSVIKENGKKNSDLFLFDTGFHKTVMLDNDLLKEGDFPVEKMKVIKKVIMKGAQGNEIPVITAYLKSLTMGNCELKNIPVLITTTNKPLKDKNVHILGNEVLKKFTMFLDFKDNFVYLKPNKFTNDKYVDEKKNGT